MMHDAMNIRRLTFDVDKAMSQPTILEIAQAIHGCPGVSAFNITVSNIDIETVGMDITIVGDYLDHDRLVEAMENTGAAVHSVDQIVCGSDIVERIARVR
ncbi:DUF211 domain-containing protein [Edwardsiella ictaluri]|nr:DUF211 domain-containing protein [Edwardsiella ictaluri]UCQ47481.1 DUF211 domain-containing protein [Edwardsiella ictaluri]UCQ50744.1 DUF211 domain-containing protein [Edwardsiella ictaluri]UYB61396.1 DUF211 domain-containing protein [Edwardsiella ictaluri]UYB64623.1 DUF211 domain-containing protein [Edwardsiella ictaluri]WFN97388.1 DUF211 domain-containing protein [Edwardsiella ictaluri]